MTICSAQVRREGSSLQANQISFRGPQGPGFREFDVVNQTTMRGPIMKGVIPCCITRHHISKSTNRKTVPIFSFLAAKDCFGCSVSFWYLVFIVIAVLVSMLIRNAVESSFLIALPNSWSVARDPIFLPFICPSAFGTGTQIGYERDEWDDRDEIYEELDAQYAKWTEQFPEALNVNTTLTKIDLTGTAFSPLFTFCSECF